MEITLDNAPLGAIAPAIGGGQWMRVEHGWKWCSGRKGRSGSTFPRPGGDWNGEIRIPFEAEQEGSGHDGRDLQAGRRNNPPAIRKRGAGGPSGSLFLGQRS